MRNVSITARNTHYFFRCADDDTGVLIAWMTSGPSGANGPAFFFRYELSYNIDYVAKKMRIGLADAEVLCKFAHTEYDVGINFLKVVSGGGV